mgnify:CR=1 FL=1
MASEFELIKRHFSRPTPQAVLGPGDDCALLVPSPGMQLAITTDMLVAGTHFLPDTDPGQLGWKALAVNLSDLAAMGARPRWALLAGSLPEARESWIAAFAEGLFACARRYDVDLVGGDTTRGSFNFCLTAIGEVPAGKALRRDRAVPGDDLWVSGQPGLAALALAHLQGRTRLPGPLAERFLAALQQPQALFLPAVNITGATGTWRTDVWIFNPETSLENDVTLNFTPAGVDGTNLEGIKITPPLAPRESVTLKDIVRTYFGRTEAYGLLEVRGKYNLLVTSNTYNVAGPQAPGTFGQYSPGQPYRSSLGFDDSVFGDLYVTGLTNDSNLRTNAVVMNPSEVSLEAGVELVDATGIVYGRRIYTVPPYSMFQLNDVFGAEFASFGPPAGGPYRLNMFVNLGNGARILGYATVTDKRTGDPYLVPAQAMRP